MQYILDSYNSLFSPTWATGIGLDSWSDIERGIMGSGMFFLTMMGPWDRKMFWKFPKEFWNVFWKFEKGFCGCLNGIIGASDLIGCCGVESVLIGCWDGWMGLIGGWDTPMALVKIGMGASDLGLKEGVGDCVTSLSKWKPQPDWQAGSKDPSYRSSQPLRKSRLGKFLNEWRSSISAMQSVLKVTNQHF